MLSPSYDKEEKVLFLVRVFKKSFQLFFSPIIGNHIEGVIFRIVPHDLECLCFREIHSAHCEDEVAILLAMAIELEAGFDVPQH